MDFKKRCSGQAPCHVILGSKLLAYSLTVPMLESYIAPYVIPYKELLTMAQAGYAGHPGSKRKSRDPSATAYKST